MNRGDIWWGEHPDAARRPFLILTREEAIPVLRKLLVVPATRTIRGIPTEVVVDETDGMPVRSALNLDAISYLPKSLLTERITRLGVERLEEVCRALRIATAC